jgi:hypothetical protein
MKSLGIRTSIGGLALLLAGLVMQGCATLSKEECRVADWYAIGYEDGLRGYPSHRFGEHRKACAEHGVTPDLDRYSAGRLVGLGEFCVPRNGYRLGRTGSGYGGVCPRKAEHLFLEAYEAGRRIHVAEAEAKRLERRLQAQISELHTLEEELAATESELVLAGTTTRRREQLLGKLRSLEAEAAEMAESIERTERALAVEHGRLAKLLVEAPQF